MKKRNNIICFIISFVLMIFLILTMAVAFFRTNIINEDLYYNVLDKNNAANIVSDTIESKIKYILLSNNIPENIANDIISKQDIQNQIHLWISNNIGYFNGTENKIESIDLDNYKTELKDNILTYLNKNKIIITNDIYEVVNEIGDSFENIIGAEMQPVDFKSLSKTSYGMKFRNICTLLNSNAMLISLIALDIVLAVLMLIVWRKSISRALAWTGYSFVSSGLIGFLIGISGYISKFYKNVAIVSENLKNNISLVIEEYLINLSKIGGIFIICGFVLILTYWVHVYRKGKRLARHRG